MDTFVKRNELLDTRSSNFLFMSTPLYPVAILFSYFYFIYKIGPKYMENRRAYELKYVLIAFNSLQIVLNTYIVIVALQEVFEFMNWSCEPIDYSNSPHALYVLRKYHIFFLTKCLDLFDTVFFVLRKRNRQITFLHVYHHWGMFLMMWLCVKFFGGGYGTWVGLINGFVHAVMYFYYLLSAMDKKWKDSPTFKKFITQMQMVQFLLFVIIYGRLFFINDCGYPKLLSYFFVPQNFFMLLLFGDFYKRAYLKKKQ